MLTLQHISKIYPMGDTVVHALDDVNLTFSSAEFVAVLGPSGCGKTTLLNIIGGLDRPDEGELIIAGRSTRNYSDREMDAYRNHSVGFVFQTYQLIPHQTVLANVELALTLSGVSAAQRRQRAADALVAVGLSDQLNKKPNQLSGGQMQRVSIARAMVNDPDVILADEPTGSLDSETSVQVLDQLKLLASDRLVIMVTHNRELAERYATRIVELKDGKVVSDSRPPEGGTEPAPGARQKKTSMGFLTALSLSLNNLLTKRARTLITAFAGSIGIIGIALILALSTGVNNYIDDIQKETMSSYPIVIEREAFNVSGMMSAMRGMRGSAPAHDLDAVYMDAQVATVMEDLTTGVSYNNLGAFKNYLEKEDNPMAPYLSDIRYGYDVQFDIYAVDKNGEIISAGDGGRFGIPAAFASFAPFSDSDFTELIPASEDGLVSDAAKGRYTLLAGEWPKNGAEVMLILDENNEIGEMTLYQLGFLPQADLRAVMGGETPPNPDKTDRWQFDQVIGRGFFLLAQSDYFIEDAKGLYRDIRGDRAALRLLVETAPRLTISGIVRAKDDQGFTSGAVGFTRAMTEGVITRSNESEAVLAQSAQQEINLHNGLQFSPQGEAEKAKETRLYVSFLQPGEKAVFAEQVIRLFPEALPTTGEGGESLGNQLPDGLTREQVTQLIQQFRSMADSPAGISGLNPGGSSSSAPLLEQWGMLPDSAREMISGLGDTQVSALLDTFIMNASDQTLALVYDALVSKQAGTWSEALADFGAVSLSAPSSISLYADTFENKDEIARLIKDYNEAADEGDRIVYTDYVALIISSITTIINVISYVLIAFVAVSLVVSSIMIGIITYISVLERTKEIGILRAVGASRKDISRVFTAEAFIIGLAAGILGVLIALVLTVPINVIVHRLAEDEMINAVLPAAGAVILVAVSTVLSLLAGFIPSRIAAGKDPVVALRTE